jgi:hypothetical protein
MKIRNKIIALMISLIAMPTFAIAKDGPYVGVKAANININYEKIDGVDIGLILPSEFNAWDFNIGYNLGNSFFELGYIKSNTEKRIKSWNFNAPIPSDLENNFDVIWCSNLRALIKFKGEKEPRENLRCLKLSIELAVGEDCSSSTACLGVDTTSKSLRRPFLVVGSGVNEI